MSLEVSLLSALPLLIVSLFHVIAQLLRGALFACETAWRMGFYICLILQKSSKKIIKPVQLWWTTTLNATRWSLYGTDTYFILEWLNYIFLYYNIDWHMLTPWTRNSLKGIQYKWIHLVFRDWRHTQPCAPSGQYRRWWRGCVCTRRSHS